MSAEPVSGTAQAPAWSAADSLGHTVWRRHAWSNALGHQDPRIQTGRAGLAEIRDRHLSFVQRMLGSGDQDGSGDGEALPIVVGQRSVATRLAPPRPASASPVVARAVPVAAAASPDLPAAAAPATGPAGSPGESAAARVAVASAASPAMTAEPSSLAGTVPAAAPAWTSGDTPEPAGADAGRPEAGSPGESAGTAGEAARVVARSPSAAPPALLARASGTAATASASRGVADHGPAADAPSAGGGGGVASGGGGDGGGEIASSVAAIEVSRSADRAPSVLTLAVDGLPSARPTAAAGQAPAGAGGPGARAAAVAAPVASASGSAVARRAAPPTAAAQPVGTPARSAPSAESSIPPNFAQPVRAAVSDVDTQGAPGGFVLPSTIVAARAGLPAPEASLPLLRSPMPESKQSRSPGGNSVDRPVDAAPAAATASGSAPAPESPAVPAVSVGGAVAESLVGRRPADSGEASVGALASPWDSAHVRATPPAPHLATASNPDSTPRSIDRASTMRAAGVDPVAVAPLPVVAARGLEPSDSPVGDWPLVHGAAQAAKPDSRDSGRVAASDSTVRAEAPPAASSVASAAPRSLDGPAAVVADRNSTGAAMIDLPHVARSAAVAGWAGGDSGAAVAISVDALPVARRVPDGDADARPFREPSMPAEIAPQRVGSGPAHGAPAPPPLSHLARSLVASRPATAGPASASRSAMGDDSGSTVVVSRTARPSLDAPFPVAGLAPSVSAAASHPAAAAMPSVSAGAPRFIVDRQHAEAPFVAADAVVLADAVGGATVGAFVDGASAPLPVVSAGRAMHAESGPSLPALPHASRQVAVGDAVAPLQPRSRTTAESSLPLPLKAQSQSHSQSQSWSQLHSQPRSSGQASATSPMLPSPTALPHPPTAASRARELLFDNPARGVAIAPSIAASRAADPALDLVAPARANSSRADRASGTTGSRSDHAEVPDSPAGDTAPALQRVMEAPAGGASQAADAALTLVAPSRAADADAGAGADAYAYAETATAEQRHRVAARPLAASAFAPVHASPQRAASPLPATPLVATATASAAAFPLPLATAGNPQRVAPAVLARAPEAASPSPPPTSAAEQTHGVIGAPGDASPAQLASAARPGAAPAPGAGIDVDDIVERAVRAMMLKLDIERERRGFSTWT